jgi:2-polyprenyl-3-methyl-5-hydroxy-6-metoxy-1,4-benzoquinol methylase
MRWQRAMRLLKAPSGARVLDVGSAFGFGTRMLARRYECVGIDSSPSFVARAHRDVPRATFLRSRAEMLPFSGQSFDAVVCLEVLEHLADESRAVEEIRRVLRPGGELVLSVPHAGALARYDSLNVHLARTGEQLSFPLGEVPSGSRWHRHYTLPRLERLLAGFEIDQTQLTGIGLAELANTALLALCRRNMRLYARLQAVYFVLAVVEDELPASRQAYNVMIHARKVV